MTLQATARAEASMPLLGRAQLVARARNLLIDRRQRLLVLTGPGGTGKTRVAWAVAAEVASDFADGVRSVDLSALIDHRLVMPTIARAVGLEEARELSILSQLQDHLRDQQLLLVLDNFEQVIDAALDLGSLLTACPSVQALVTSRAPLRLSSERELPVPPLEVPDVAAARDPDVLAQNPSVALFVERARAAYPDFGVTAENARAVAEVCVRLDGLPLALELAAARIKMLSPAAILVRLEQTLALLTRGAQDWPARHRTMRSAIAWSYDLLDPDAQALFRRLAVFSGGCSLGAAAAVSEFASAGEIDLLDGIGSLVDHSLVRREESIDAEPRFGLLETIRAFAQECLRESGELEACQARHASYFLTLAEEAEPQLWGPRQAAWLDRLERERDNLRAALGWTTRPGTPDSETALRLVGALWRFWSLNGHLREGREWSSHALSLRQPVRLEVRGHALKAAGNLERAWGDYSTARAYYTDGLSLCRASNDRRGLATILSNMGNLAYDQGDYSAACELWDESRAHREELNDHRGVALLLNKLGNCASAKGDYAAARSFHEESFKRFRELDDAWGVAVALDDLGICALLLGDAAAAMRLHRESLQRFESLGEPWGMAHAQKNLGRALLVQGEVDAAADLFRLSLSHFRDIGEKQLVGIALGDLAQVALARGNPELAARLLGAEDSLRASTSASLAAPDAAMFDSAAAAARSALSAHAFDAACRAGAQLPLDDAVELALREAARVHERPSPLTPRETEVAHHVARGMTNRQIADELVITERTAETHLERIFTKLDLRSRAQLTRWIVEREPRNGGATGADGASPRPPKG